MNAEKVLAALNEIVEQIDKDCPDYDFRSLFELAVTSIISGDNGAPSMMADLCKELQMDILNSKNKCKANRAKAVLRILKNSVKLNPNKTGLHNAVVDDDGTIMVCDGYRAIIFENLINGVPTSSDKIMLKLKNSVLHNSAFEECDKSLYVGSLAELKNELKIDKANKNYIECNGGKKTYLYFFGTNNIDGSTPVVNLEYLIDIVEAMQNPSASYNSKKAINGVYFTDNENNKAILLPIKPNNVAFGNVLVRKATKN